MKDFLRGTIGILLQVGLGILGLILLVAAFFMKHGWICLLLAILCFAAIGGIRYWLGSIVRLR